MSEEADTRRDGARGAPRRPRVGVTRDGHLVLDNPGREVGEDDRPGGPGLPTNQGGGRDGGAPPKSDDDRASPRGRG